MSAQRFKTTEIQSVYMKRKAQAHNSQTAKN